MKPQVLVLILYFYFSLSSVFAAPSCLSSAPSYAALQFCMQYLASKVGTEVENKSI